MCSPLNKNTPESCDRRPENTIPLPFVIYQSQTLTLNQKIEEKQIGKTNRESKTKLPINLLLLLLLFKSHNGDTSLSLASVGNLQFCLELHKLTLFNISGRLGTLLLQAKVYPLLYLLQGPLLGQQNPSHPEASRRPGLHLVGSPEFAFSVLVASVQVGAEQIFGHRPLQPVKAAHVIVVPSQQVMGQSILWVHFDASPGNVTEYSSCYGPLLDIGRYVQLPADAYIIIVGES